MRHVCGSKRFVSIAFGFVVVLAACGRHSERQNYFPEIGANGLYQRSLDLRSDLNVLSIALKPGYEDLAALAYFRLGRGARIMSAYVSNGEAGESDIRGQYPPYLAGALRKEATAALSYLDGDATFLNLPDIAAARDLEWLRQSWPSDSLRSRLAKLIDQFKPDLIVLNRDCGAEGKSLKVEALLSDVLAVVESVAGTTETNHGTDHLQRNRWAVSRVVVDDGLQRGLTVPIDERAPRWGKSYRDIGDEAGSEYEEIAIQHKAWGSRAERSYRIAYPAPAPEVDAVVTGLPVPVSPRLRSLEEQVRGLTDRTLKGETQAALGTIVTLLDTISFRIAQRSAFNERDQRALFTWKKGLDDLRCTLLGVKVEYTVSDTALTIRQLTYLTIDDVAGLSEDGTTFIYFGGLEDGWGVNEGFERRLPFKLNEAYRLLSPAEVSFTTPQALYAQHGTKIAKPMMFFIIHRASSPQKSFVHRTVVDLTFAPRFVTEILTPIVRMVPGEWIKVRLTNFSRDGVVDTVRVDDELVTSTAGPFRLSNKEDSQIATLKLAWRDHPEDGTHLIPVRIHGLTVAHFAARKFTAVVDTSKTVAVVSGLQDSPLESALRRLGATYSVIGPHDKIRQQIDAFDVVIVDRRATTLRPGLASEREKLESYVRRGGHLIFLAQDATAWNAEPFWKEVRLTSTQLLDEGVQLRFKQDVFLTSPNLLGTEDWRNWLFLRGYNIVSLQTAEGVEVPVRASERGDPLLVTKRIGQGRITYVDLALDPQLANVHAGAFRLLANLISNRAK